MRIGNRYYKNFRLSQNTQVNSCIPERQLLPDQYFWDNFSFDDDTEILYDLPIRSFTSFQSTADERLLVECMVDPL